MLSRVQRLLAVMAVSAFMLSLASISSAQRRGNFYGSYRISNVSKSGEQVEFTLNLTLRNGSGSEVQGAGVVLYNSAPNPSPLGAFTEIQSLPTRGQVAAAQRFTVSEAQFAKWSRGLQPTLRLLVNEPGGAREERIDLAPAPSPAVENQ